MGWGGGGGEAVGGGGGTAWNNTQTKWRRVGGDTKMFDLYQCHIISELLNKTHEKEREKAYFLTKI